ncbi:MAG: TolC family protein [Deltaproteobacteria bacterium]|nr:MAG: TolC family protein [Deltaproteobacteria bacterium]
MSSVVNTTTKTRLWSCFGILLSLMQACAIYKPLPLDDSAIAAKLEPPNVDAVRVQAKEITHPVLKPIDFDIGNGLSPDEAAILAVLANPKLRALRDQRRVAAAQLLQAGILPNPQLSYSLDIPTAGMTKGTFTAFNFSPSWEITSVISQGAKIAAAKADAAAVDLDVAWQEWQVAEAAKLHVYHLGFFNQQLAVSRQEEEGLKENLNRVKRAADLGYMTRIDLAAADAALQKMHISVLTTEQQREEERLALNQSLGFSDEQNLPLEQNIEPPSPKRLLAASQLIQGLEQRRLDLLALKIGYQAQEERLRGAILAQFPKINIGFSHAGDTSNVITTGFGITIDLPLFDRNQGAIAVETATRAKLFDEYIARLFEARGEIGRILTDMNSLQRQIEAVEKSIPTLQNVVESYRTALLQGNADVLTYYNARITKRMELLDLKRQLADMEVGLEIAAGRFLETADKKETTP